MAAMASHSKADDLEVVEEKIVKRYKPVSTKSIRIPIKVSVLMWTLLSHLTLL